MPIQIDDLQRTDDWYEDRRGKITASKFKIIMGKPTNKGYQEYARQLADERLGAPLFEDRIGMMSSLKKGRLWEHRALGMYELRNQEDLIRPGFVDSTDIEWFGCSPDAFSGAVGLVEAKIATEVHIQISRLEKGMEGLHKHQVQAQILATGREWCDFISYCPRFDNDDPRCFFQQRVYRDEEYLQRALDAIYTFNQLVHSLTS